MPIRRSVLSGVAVLLAVVTACGNPVEDGRNRAADKARAAAAVVRTVVAEEVVAPSAPRGAALAVALPTLVGDAFRLRTVFGSSSDADGTVHLLVAFDGSDQSGGGGTYTQVTVRLCVEYVITAGNDPQVGLQDHLGSAELLASTGPTRTPEFFVTLG